MAIVNLLAGKDFRRGELGYATSGRVGPLSTGFVPADGQMVRALEDVRAGENGNFVEIELVEKASKEPTTDASRLTHGMGRVGSE